MTSRKVIAGAAVLAPTVLTGCASSLHKMPIGMAQRVTDWQEVYNVFRDDKIYFAGQPTSEALREAPGRGIKLVVNLRTAEEMSGPTGYDEAALARELGMEYVSIPVTGETFNNPSGDEVRELREVLARTSSSVLIHCASSNRVGALWALYLHHHRGFDLDEAIKRGEAAGMFQPALINAVRLAAPNHRKSGNG